jgi:hypothetical protein
MSRISLLCGNSALARSRVGVPTSFHRHRRMSHARATDSSRFIKSVVFN